MTAFFAILLIAIFWIAPIFASNAIGKNKGRTNTWVWGLVLGWLGVIIVACLSPQSRGTVLVPPVVSTAQATAALPTPPAEMKTCPRCAEEVQAAAKVCRYCSHSFEVEAPQELAPGTAGS